MISKIHVICNRHDESLISLYQESLFLEYPVVPHYHNKNHPSLDSLKTSVAKEDYLMLLHTHYGAEAIYDIIKDIDCKKILNFSTLKNMSIGDKLFQQRSIKELNNSLHIETHTNLYDIDITNFPLIAKPRYGSNGNGVVLLKNKEPVPTVTDNVNYIFQRYIKNDGDWRVVVVGGRAISGIKRLGRFGQVANNIAKGSFAVVEKDDKVLDSIFNVAETAARHFKFDYVGIDVIQDKETDNYYFLESNERATFETSQLLTGTNIAQEIIKELVK